MLSSACLFHRTLNVKVVLGFFRRQIFSVSIGQSFSGLELLLNGRFRQEERSSRLKEIMGKNKGEHFLKI